MNIHIYIIYIFCICLFAWLRKRVRSAPRSKYVYLYIYIYRYLFTYATLSDVRALCCEPDVVDIYTYSYIYMYFHICMFSCMLRLLDTCSCTDSVSELEMCVLEGGVGADCANLQREEDFFLLWRFLRLLPFLCVLMFCLFESTVLVVGVCNKWLSLTTFSRWCDNGVLQYMLQC